MTMTTADITCRAHDLDVLPLDKINDLSAWSLMFRGNDGDVWGTSPATLSFFQITDTRLSQFVQRKGFPARAKKTIGGRVVWNLSAIERFLIASGRPNRGPEPRHIARLRKAGLLSEPMPRRKRLN